MKNGARTKKRTEINKKRQGDGGGTGRQRLTGRKVAGIENRKGGEAKSRNKKVEKLG